MNKPELLAPAGNLEKLKIALIYGADAVYLSGKSFGLRAFSDNFDLDELKAGVEFAHNLKKKVYVTINIYPHNEDLAALPAYLKYLAEIGADAVIVSDPGVFRLAQQTAPDLKIHVSTQANTTNWSAVLFWQDLGAERVVLARELSLRDIALIKTKVDLELESFVHGAMCVSYSGRCLLSNYFTNRDANRGECAQPCRWKYALVEESRPGNYFPIAEDERGTYIFNSKDLCLIEYLPELIKSGLASFKIEGRMKSVHYVATVVKTYREAIDEYWRDPAAFSVRPEWLLELAKISHRDYTTGFYFPPQEPGQIYSSSSYQQTHDFVGLVKEYDIATGIAVVEQRNNIKAGETIEIMQPGKPNFIQTVIGLKDADGNEITAAPHPQQIFSLPLAQEVVPNAMLRRLPPSGTSKNC
ncbi:MAG: U32 family peptidase [Sporomusaceae bacterium]|nr:U32 family peptidase [Sporomusaceae bacterium]